MRVKIREEKDHYLTYFIDSRRIVGINEAGATILELLLNQDKPLDVIADIIATDYSIPLSQVKEDVVAFLEDIKKEVFPEGFSLIEQEQLSVPLGVELEITPACNLRCRHCFQGSYDKVFMPLEKAIEIIDLLAGHNVFEINLIGGEPFLHKNLFEIIKHCEKHELAINVVTNGTLLGQEVIEKLASIKRFVLIVSLDGLERTHDYIRGEGVFQIVNSALRKLLEKDVAVEVIDTLNSVNLPEYKEVIKYCQSLDIPCNFSLFKPFKPEHDALIPDPEEIFAIIVDLLSLRSGSDGYKKIGLSNAAIVADLLGLPPRNECRATLSGLVIDVSGRMITCPSLVAAGYYREEELPFFDENFLETWKNHETFVKFRENGFRECQARAYIFSKDVRGYDPYGINAFKKFRAS